MWFKVFVCKIYLIMEKRIFLLILFLLSVFTYNSNAQNDTIWYNANWKKTTKSKASFYRPPVEKKENGYWVEDFYISGAKQMEALSTNPNEEVYDGTAKWFHENGNIFQIVNYNNGITEGERKVFYESGKPKTVSFYKNGKLEGVWKEYFENGKLKETGKYENGQRQGIWKMYYLNGKLKMEGKYVFNNKIDTWKTYYYDGMEEK